MAAIAVVLEHATAIVLLKTGQAPFGGWLGPGWVGVDFFFVLSGFIIASAHMRDSRDPHRIGTYFIRRIVRIFPAYLAVTIPLAAVYFADPHLGESYDRSVTTLVQSLFLWPAPTRVLAPAWSLSFEMFFYILMGVALLLPPRVALAGAATWAVCIALHTFSLPMHTGGLDVISASRSFALSPFNLEFLIGVSLAIVLRGRALPRPTAYLSVTAASGAFLGVWLASGGGLLMYYSPETILILGPSSALIIAGLVSIERATPTLSVPRSAALLGDASYSIYLTQLPAMACFVMILTALHVFTPPFLAGDWILLCIGAVFVGLTFHFVVERPLLAITAHIGRLAALWRGAADNIEPSSSHM
jgi:exopolysaccharide production protein ExoZ